MENDQSEKQLEAAERVLAELCEHTSALLEGREEGDVVLGRRRDDRYSLVERAGRV